VAVQGNRWVSLQVATSTGHSRTDPIVTVVALHLQAPLSAVTLWALGGACFYTHP